MVERSPEATDGAIRMSACLRAFMFCVVPLLYVPLLLGSEDGALQVSDTAEVERDEDERADDEDNERSGSEAKLSEEVQRPKAPEVKPRAMEVTRAALPPAGAGRTPLVTASILYDTAEFLQAVYDRYFSRVGSRLLALAYSLVAFFFGPAPIRGLCSRFGFTEQDGENLLIASRHLASGAAALEARLAQWTALAVDLFEEAQPRHRGLISKRTDDFAVFLVYASLVVYTLSVAIRSALHFCKLLCCACCCCCRRCSRRAEKKPPLLYRQELPVVSRPPWLPSESTSLTQLSTTLSDMDNRYNHEQRKRRVAECCSLFG